MAIFRLLHASDLHIAEKPNGLGLADVRFNELWGQRGSLDFEHFQSTHDLDMLHALSQYAHSHRRELDIVVVTGDLASTGLRADMETARTRLASPAAGGGYLAEDGGPTLGFLGRKLKLMPGNHDRFSSTPLCAPGGAVFDDVFPEYWSEGQGARQLATRVKDGSSLALIAADFTLKPGEYDITMPFMHFGSGCVYEDRLRKLEALTRKAQRKGAAVLWAVHFSPDCGEESLRLYDEAKLIRAAQDLEVVAILCGHTHGSVTLRSVAGVRVSVCGSSAQDFVRGGNFIHRVEVHVPGAGRPASVLVRRLRYHRFHGFVPAP